MSSDSPESRDSSRLIRLRAWLLGPRYIDPLIRAFALIQALTGFLPRAMESHEPNYVVFFIAGRLLFLIVAFTPWAGGVISATLFVAFGLAFPQYLNMFQEPLIFALMVAVTHLKVATPLMLGMLIVALTWWSHLVTPEVASRWHLVAYPCTEALLLGAGAGYVERRLRKEINLRSDQARKHEREIFRQRVRFATGTHDTVAHGLARQAAILRILRSQPHTPDVQQMLEELDSTVSTTHRELRSFLNALQLGNAVLSGEDFRSHIEAEFRRLSNVAASQGLDLKTDLNLDASLEISTPFEDARFILRELVTNLVKHAPKDGEHTLSASTERTGELALLQFETRSATSELRPATPLSLRIRAESLSGNCEISQEGAFCRVIVRIPQDQRKLPEIGEAESAGNAVAF